MPILKNVTGKKLVVHEEIKGEEREEKKNVLQMIPRQLSPRNDEGLYTTSTPRHAVRARIPYGLRGRGVV